MQHVHEQKTNASNYENFLKTYLHYILSFFMKKYCFIQVFN